MSHFDIKDTGLYDVVQQIVAEYSHPSYFQLKNIIQKRKYENMEPYEWYFNFLVKVSDPDKIGVDFYKLFEYCEDFFRDKEYFLAHDIMRYFGILSLSIL